MPEEVKVALSNVNTRSDIKHQVKFWRGSRNAYNDLEFYDFWTRYSVRESNGSYTEYFGTNCITPTPGQLLPVKSIVASLPSVLNPGDRYLVGSGSTYYIVEIHSDIAQSKIEPLGNFSVRVEDRNMMEYQLINGKLESYDEGVDCGTFGD